MFWGVSVSVCAAVPVTTEKSLMRRELAVPRTGDLLPLSAGPGPPDRGSSCQVMSDRKGLAAQGVETFQFPRQAVSADSAHCPLS